MANALYCSVTTRIRGGTPSFVTHELPMTTQKTQSHSVQHQLLVASNSVDPTSARVAVADKSWIFLLRDARVCWISLAPLLHVTFSSTWGHS